MMDATMEIIEKETLLPAGVSPEQVGASRKIAKEMGLRYFTGSICKRGHEAGLRHTSDGACVACKHECGTSEEHRECCRQYHAEHREELNEKSRQYRSDHREELNENRRQYRSDHREEMREKERQYRADHREEKCEKNRRYRLASPDLAAAQDGLKRARRCGAKIPGRVRDIVKVTIPFYAAARRLSEEAGSPGAFAVDHMIPCSCGGLHHPDNLIVVSREENQAKVEADRTLTAKFEAAKAATAAMDWSKLTFGPRPEKPMKEAA